MNNKLQNIFTTNESDWVRQCFESLCRLEEAPVLPNSDKEAELKLLANRAYIKMIERNNQQIDM